MVWLHFIFLFAIIIYAAKLGGIGVGMAGGLGMAVAVFFSVSRPDRCLLT